MCYHKLTRLLSQTAPLFCGSHNTKGPLGTSSVMRDPDGLDFNMLSHF